MHNTLVVLNSILALESSLVGAMIGIFFVAPFEAKGRTAIMRQWVLAIIFALLIPAIPALIWGFDIYTKADEGTLAQMVLGGAGLGVVISASITSWVIPGRVKKFLALVPAVAPFAAANFKALDIDGDGVLSDGDLGHALKDPAFAAAEKQNLIKFMRRHIRSIGHGVGSYVSYNAASNSSSSKQVSVISPRDLDSYAPKTLKKYKSWL